MKLKRSINNFEEAKGSLNITLYQSNFDSDNYYGKVSRRTVNLKQLIADIAKKNEGVTELMVEHIASLLQTEIVQLLGYGFSVNILDLGILYLAAQGRIADNTHAAIPDLSVKFSPSQILTDTAASLNVEKILIGSGMPTIKTVEDTFDSRHIHALTAGKVARITGTNIKIDGDASGLYFATADENDNAEKDESKWILVSSMLKNMPSALEFYVPDTLDMSKKFQIVIKTKYKNRKECAYAYSPTVSVSEYFKPRI